MSTGIVGWTRQGVLGGLTAGVFALTMAPAMADKTPAASPGWQKLENLSPVMGVDGKPHTASCSGYPGTDSRFNFWTKRGKSKNLVVYFEGGGACWNDFTCTFPISAALPAQVPQFFMPSIGPDINPAAYDGIFSAANPANPVKDWDFVYIPYCTGDVHTGSATRNYFNAGHPVFPLPNDFNIQHRGFDNFMVVLDWMKKHIDEPGRILVAGSSAGGYGASAHFPWVQKVFPKARISVLADASQGVNTSSFDTSTPGRGSWNPQLPRWVFGDDPTQVASQNLLRTAAKAYPKTRVAQFTTNFDAVQIGFYGLIKAFHPPGGACPNPAIDWNSQMLSTLQSYAATTKNYRHYLASGQYHTILRSSQFYTEASAGVAFKDWVDDMLQKGDGEGEGRSDDHRGRHGPWQNVACPGCLFAVPCQ